jgi:hypothetical protein
MHEPSEQMNSSFVQPELHSNSSVPSPQSGKPSQMSSCEMQVVPPSQA